MSGAASEPGLKNKVKYTLITDYVPNSYKGITRDLHVSVELVRDSQVVRSPWLTLPASDFRPSENFTGEYFRRHFLVSSMDCLNAPKQFLRFYPTSPLYSFHNFHNTVHANSFSLIPTTPHQIPACIGNPWEPLWKDFFFHCFLHLIDSLQVPVHAWPCLSRSLTKHPQKNSKCIDVVRRVTQLACTMVLVHFW